MRPALRLRPIRGSLHVPYMVDSRPSKIDFRVLDPKHVDACAQRSLCGVCGTEVRRGKDRAVFLGPLRDLECFDTPWMHEDCAVYVEEHCPFVGSSAERRHYREPSTDPLERELLGPYTGAWMKITALRWRAHRIAGGWHFQPKVTVKREALDTA